MPHPTTDTSLLLDGAGVVSVTGMSVTGVLVVIDPPPPPSEGANVRIIGDATGEPVPIVGVPVTGGRVGVTGGNVGSVTGGNVGGSIGAIIGAPVVGAASACVVVSSTTTTLLVIVGTFDPSTSSKPQLLTSG